MRLGAIEGGSSAEGLERVAQIFYSPPKHRVRRLCSNTTPPHQCRTSSHTNTPSGTPDSAVRAGIERWSAGSSVTDDRTSMNVAESVPVWGGLPVADVPDVPCKVRCLPDNGKRHSSQDSVDSALREDSRQPKSDAEMGRRCRVPGREIDVRNDERGFSHIRAI
jgi:hypothetical protein